MQRALELDPKSVAAVNALGQSYFRLEPKDYAQAETYMRRLVELEPDEAKAYEWLGDLERARNDLQAALEAYTQATDRDPALAMAQQKKGHVDSFLGNFEEARAAYDAAMETARPENKLQYANFRAFIHIHAGEIQAALDELVELVGAVEKMGTPEDQVEGNKVFTLTNHVTVALHHGKLDQAAKALAQRNALQREIGEEVGTEDSKRLQEANCLAWDGLLAAYQGEYELAAKKAEENAKLLEEDQNPRKLEAHHRVLGVAHLLQEDYAPAAEHLRQADHQNTMYIRYQLALAEEGAGNTEEARRLFKEVAEWNFNSVGFALVRKDAAKRAGLDPAGG
jgi:tetratricopeptide (TPR) repeat protein